MKIPSLPFAPDDFSRYPERSQLAHEAKAPAPELIAELHNIVKTGMIREIDIALMNAGYDCNAPGMAVLFMAIEPTTGNSLMHTAVISQRIDAMNTLRHFRTHNDAWYYEPLYALYSHQNKRGDTMLHSAVQTGRLDLVTAVFQVFRGESINEPDERLQSAEAEGPVWDEDVEPNEMRIGEIMFLLKQNVEGRTAAAEARALGHEDIAVWLERAVQLDDPQREREDPSIFQLWQENCEEFYGLP